MLSFPQNGLRPSLFVIYIHFAHKDLANKGVHKNFLCPYINLSQNKKILMNIKMSPVSALVTLSKTFLRR